MKLGISSVLPRRAIDARKASVSAASTRQLTEAAASDTEALLKAHGSLRTGLSDDEAERRLEQVGPNAVASEQEHGQVRLLGKALLNPVLSQNWNETKVSDAGDLRDGEGGLYRWDLDA
jgi:Cation transporter/ATPase, N-terminus